ncbi:MAG: efflux RND transporter permease subunit [Gammaproteobacteria bacterium]|nr:MAG: efflux RND transporter permease subunit [Gammaproteobacteria bacterium]
MNITQASLGNPVAVLVAVLMVVIFGALSLQRLPIQLTPEVQSPEITISTRWRAAAPEEVEQEIVEPQERVLRGMPGMTEMLSKVRRGEGEITVTLEVGTSLTRALLEVMNRLNQVPDYPDDADEPLIKSVGGDASPIAWFILGTTPENDKPIDGYEDYIEEVVQARFEQVFGVAESQIRGARGREVRITFDPWKAASLGIELPIASTLAGSGEDVSGGFNEVGKRRYTLRFTGAYEAEKLGELIVEWRDGKPVMLRDVAEVDIQLEDRNSFVISKGELVVAVNALRETGVNVLDVMDGLHEAMRELQDGPLKEAGLTIEQVYDETIYINRAVTMLRNNLGLGIILAVGVLWWFLRRFRATLMVAVAIPACVLAAFIVMYGAGRTLNVISLAGLAFAVGMVLDASIVVLENIVRLREHGNDSETAALKGAGQVWGALLASTATTVAIFLPIVFLEDEAGQLFADLALTISIAVTASLFVAIAVIPAAAKVWFHQVELTDPHHDWWERISDQVMRITNTPNQRRFWIMLLLIVPLSITILAVPKADYLPTGNRNLVFAFILPPPGSNISNIEQIKNEMGDVIAAEMQPYLTGEKQPQMKHYFFVAFPFGVFMGARAVEDSRIREVIPKVQEMVSKFPDTFGIAKQASLFRGFREGRSIDVNIQGREIESILTAAQTGYGVITKVLPGSQILPLPSLQLGEPELRLEPDERRIVEAGWNRSHVAGIVRALGDGLYVGDYFDGQTQLDIILRGQPWDTPEQLMSTPLATPNADILPLSELVHMKRTAGPEELRRTNRRRTITLQVTPPDDTSLEEALETIQQQAAPAIKAQLPEGGSISYTGAADKLKLALESMGDSFVLAVVILYLLMSALFRSFKDSLLVMLAIPLATVGGVLALRVTGLLTFQPMDLLTMIGFVILLGLVVNNAILLVHQTRAAEREGTPRRDAVNRAVHLRLRPILMSTLTSLFGMLPLLLIPGPGSELYRGLAAVIVGGMAVSTIFTLILLPSLLRVGEEKAIA